ncbi:hypothetical protein GCM10011428_72720 [Streptomyces violaceus]
MVELPALTAVLDPLWGRITRVTVNPTQWPVIPRKVPVAGHVVTVGWFLAEQDPHELLLLSYHVGRFKTGGGGGASVGAGRRRPGRGSGLGLRRRA